MLRLLVLSALALSLTGAASAQRRDVLLGLKAGGVRSSFIGMDAAAYRSVYGLQAGIFVNRSYGYFWAFQPELLYSEKGTITPDGPSGSATQRLRYLDLPLLCHFSFWGNKTGWFAEAGPQVGLLLAATQESGTVVDNKSTGNSLDVGYLLGLGYQLRIGRAVHESRPIRGSGHGGLKRKSCISLGLRYNGGLTNVSQSFIPIGAVAPDHLRNSAVQAYLTFSRLVKD